MTANCERGMRIRTAVRGSSNEPEELAPDQRSRPCRAEGDELPHAVQNLYFISSFTDCFLASSVLGMRTFRTPFLSSALAFLVSTPEGSEMRLAN